MKTYLTFIFILFSSLFGFCQTKEWQTNEKVELSNLLPIKTTNGKAIDKSYFDKKINILVFADLKNVEGLLLIDDIINLQKENPKIQFTLFDEGVSVKNNAYYIKNFNQLYNPNFPVISDDSLVFKALNIEQSPSVFVFKPDYKFIGKMQIEELNSMLKPFLQDFKDSTKSELISDDLFKPKNKFKSNKPFFQKISSGSDSNLIISNWSDTSIFMVNYLSGKKYEIEIPEEVSKPFASYYYQNQIWFSDLATHNIYMSTGTKTSKILGNGERETFRMQGKDPRAPLNFPMDLLIENNVLYTTLAGSHQIWEYYLNTENKGYYFAGDANYASFFVDGYRYEASLRYPLDIEKVGNAFFFIDAGLNLIRQVEGGYLSTPSFNVDLPIENPVAITASDLFLFVLDGASKKLYMVDLYHKKVELFMDFELQKGVKNYQFPKDIAIKKNSLFILFDRKNELGKIDLTTGDFSWIKY